MRVIDSIENQNRKALVLCSGGYDSVILMNEIATEYDHKEIEGLFFNYGQRNEKEEYRCAKKVCNKYNIHLKKMTIPMVNKHNVLTDTNINAIDRVAQYIPMRNLIFLSYAISYAQEKGYNDIYLALLESISYPDTNEFFVKCLNGISQQVGIKIHAPYNNLNKYDLGFYARKYNVTKDEFFSCNVPIEQEGKLIPCGKCDDCITIKDVYNKVIEDTTPIQAWLHYGCKPTKVFEQLFIDKPIEEVRLLTNNSCQFKCDHCFYGFDKMLDKPLKDTDFFKIIDECSRLGVKNIHFSGKEPLINADVFKYAKYIHTTTSMTCNLVTNGVNISKYINEFRDSKMKVFLSVDTLSSKHVVRDSNPHIKPTINLLLSNNIETEIFIDLTTKNSSPEDLLHTLTFLYYQGIRKFYIREVLPLGKNKDNMIPQLISMEELNGVLETLIELTEDPTYKDIDITFNIKNLWSNELVNSDHYKDLYPLYDVIQYNKATSDSKINPNLALIIQYYCSPFEEQITITPDGYVLGCATEVSCSNYIDISVGNVKDKPLKELILKGKHKTLDRINKVYKEKGNYIPFCFHTQL